MTDCRTRAHGWETDYGAGNGKKSIRVLLLDLGQKRAVVKILHEQQGYPVELACDLLDLPRSNYNHRSRPRNDPAVVPAMKAIAGQFPTYGILLMTNQLRRSPYMLVVNHKCVEQIMGQEGLLQPRRRKKCRTTNSEHPLPALSQPGQRSESKPTGASMGQ